MSGTVAMGTETALAELIREVLAEELARMKPVAAPDIRQESVRIENDADLQAFVRRVLELAGDPVARKALEAGRIRFTLARATMARQGRPDAVRRAAAPEAGGETVATIEKGFVSERHVDRLGRDVRRVVLGKAVRLTPLARDRLRQRGIAIERMDR